MPEVSIVIPVYNSCDYLDECLNSAVNQTYSDMEIILINDGSTDGSDKKCEAWAKKDKRIIYINKNNEGAGIARNTGIKAATGNYIAFIDSDDWVDNKFIEKMHNAIASNNVDIVECDYYRVIGKSLHYISSNGVLGKQVDIKERMLSPSSNSLCTMMVRRSFLLENKIEMPALPYEDIAVYLLILALGKKIYSLNEALYYYRFGRNNSNSNSVNIEEYFLLTDALLFLANSFKKRFIYDEYAEILKKHAKMYLTKVFTKCCNFDNIKDIERIKLAYNSFLKQQYNGWGEDKSFLVLGSYSLGKISNNLVGVGDVNAKYNFTSIISLNSVKNIDAKIIHNNPYRQKMLNNDFNKNFFEALNAENPDYILIDFLDERFNIVEHNGSYYTKSDAFDEAEHNITNYSIILRQSDECKALWQNSVISFINALKRKLGANKIILVENYLAEQYGNLKERKYYDNLEEIRQTNKLLADYYSFFKLNYNEIYVVEAYKSQNYFTDENFSYGRYPWHLNDIVYMETAEKILKLLNKKAD